MKSLNLCSWNVNGLRSVLRKNALQDFLKRKSPDVLCLQEIKCKPSQLDLFENSALENYEIFWHPAERSGYSGTMTLIKKESELTIEPRTPLFENKEASTEGRVLTLDLGKFFLVNVYTPNSKPDLSRLKLREKDWDPAFLKFLKTLEKEKSVVACGDFNAAHEEIDLARPKQNHHHAGFTDEERKGITNLLDSGFIDTFRSLNPDTKRYTWWSHWGNARKNNIGWRIDYFFISKSLKKNLKSAEIYESEIGSDHCPVSITLEI